MNEIVRETFGRVFGLPCWGTWWDSQLGLKTSFGPPHLRIREPVSLPPGRKWEVAVTLDYRAVHARGDWRLFVFCAHWKLSLQDLDPVTSASSQRRAQAGLARLDGQKLVGATVNRRTGKTRLFFDLGAVLDVRRLDPTEDGAMWFLYAPGKRVLAVRGDGQFSYGCVGSPKDRVWEPISSEMETIGCCETDKVISAERQRHEKVMQAH